MSMNQISIDRNGNVIGHGDAESWQEECPECGATYIVRRGDLPGCPICNPERSDYFDEHDHPAEPEQSASEQMGDDEMKIEFVAKSAEEIAKRNSVRDSFPAQFTDSPRTVELYSILLNGEQVGEIERYGMQRQGQHNEYCAEIQREAHSSIRGYGFADNREKAFYNAIINLQEKIEQAHVLVNQLRQGFHFKATISEAAFGARELVEA